MRIIRVPMTVDTPAAAYSLRLTLPDHAKVAAIGLDCSPGVALFDHEVTSVKHGSMERVTLSQVASTLYGVMLGHVASSADFEAGPVNRLALSRFKPWPGRFNWDRDWQHLQQKIRDGIRLSWHESLRLKFASAVPVERFTILPLKPSVEFTISVARVAGSTSITHADLVCVEFDKDEDIEAFEMVCGMADLTDYPHWLSQALILPAAAVTQSDLVERKWVEVAIQAPHALRVVAPMYMAHSNNGSGVITHAPDYLNNVLLNFKGDEGGQIWPSFANFRRRLGHQAVEILQHFDESRRLDRVMKWRSSLNIETQTLATSLQKDLRGGFYGLLRPQSKAGDVEDVTA